MTDDDAAREVERIAAKHVDTISCGLPLHEDGTRDRPPFDGVCGWAERDAVHDLYPDVSKRGRLPTGVPEAFRHAFVPGEPRGICAGCRDDWPCDAVALLRLLDSQVAHLGAALLRMVNETYEAHHTPSSESGPEEWDYTLSEPTIEAVEQALRAYNAVFQPNPHPHHDES